jgi:hypothetical protein
MDEVHVGCRFEFRLTVRFVRNRTVSREELRRASGSGGIGGAPDMIAGLADTLPTWRGDVSQVGNRRRALSKPDGPGRAPVDDGGGDEARVRHYVGRGFDFCVGAVRFLFAATRRAAASATRAQVTSSSGSSNSRSGARQKERSMVQPCFS